MHKRGSFITALALAMALAATGAAWADDGDAADSGKNKKDSKSGAAAKPDEAKGDEKPFDQVIKDMEEVKGLFTFYRKVEDNKLLMEIQPAQLDSLFLFAASVDRSTGERGFYAGMMDIDFPFYFHRVGKNLQWVMKNTSFVAAAGTPQARTTERSFANSILASVKIQSKPHPDRKSLLVDVGELFAARDFPGYASALSDAYKPTNYSFDKEKTSVSSLKAFPENVLLGVALGYQTENFKGTTTTLADPRSVGIGVKYSLSSIPKTSYKPRLADDRVGHFLVVRQDFTTDKAQTPYLRYVQRWNLEKQDPSAPLSPPKQPIVFWLENTIPVEYRDTIREGTLLWNKAFEKVGFKDAVVVKQMPDDADWDPADVRYNTIRWFAGVDATFAIGPRRANPFTGEIYDADIGMSEGIVRNVRRFAEEYLTPVTGASQGPARIAWSQDLTDQCSYADGLVDQASLGLAMLDARGTLDPALEQRLMHEYVLELTAHEVGHTLGLRHNFHASTLLPANELLDEKKTLEIGQSSSVMDYNPVIVAAKGETQGPFVPVVLGPYDYWATEYAYTPIEGDEAAGLAKIAARGSDPALQYSTDEDALGTYSPLAMDPLVNQYDASTDPLSYFRKRLALVNELWGSMETRLAKPGDGYQILRRAMSRSLNDDYRSLVTSSKFIGGVYHHRDHVGDPGGRAPFEPVPAAKQREALDLLSRYAFSEKAFTVPASLLNKLAIERNYGLDPAYWNVVRIDFPWHNQVLNIQKTVLDRLYHPVTLGRILDNELRFGPDEQAFRMSDMFNGLSAAIWSELDGSATRISSLRRNLQRAHLRDLTRIVLGEGTVTVDAGGGPMPVRPPEDAVTLSRASLTRLQTKIRAKLAGKAALDATTRAHLQESLASIGSTLSAQTQRTVD